MPGLQTNPVPEYRKFIGTVTLDSSGFKRICQVKGLVNIVWIAGRCTEANNPTTVQAAALNTYTADTTPVADITESAIGTDLSGISPGDFVVKIDKAATALAYIDCNPSFINVLEFPTSADERPAGILIGVLPQKSGNGIAIVYTGDKDTDVDIEFEIIYQVLSTNGELTAP